jgi:phosphoribosylformimino-5-aminoimidazole carboxamide ribotide isomerase
VQVGGVTDVSDIEQLLRLGAELVVVGDRGIEEPEWLADVADLYPDAIGAATDVRDRRVVRRGWVRTLPVDILDLVDELNAMPLHELLVNLRPLDDAVRFGELALLEDVAERSRCPVLVAGGISTIADLRALEHRGIAGALIDAEKLLDGTFEAREVAQEFDA